MSLPLADQVARERAATASNENIVVTAGAGTGKTTLLIDRLTHLLFRPDRRLTIGQIVALTFTNKAANEMKVRLRQRLQVMQDLARAGWSEKDSQNHEAKVIRDLQILYGLTDQQIADVAERTFYDLERAHIETIHSFAGYVLRLFPVEAGVDPSFQEDDGTQFASHFHEEWNRWLNHELQKDGPNRECWRAILRLVRLEDLEKFACALMNELLPSGCLAVIQDDESIPQPIRNWILGLLQTARELRRAHDKEQKLELLLDEAIDQLNEAFRGAPFEPEIRESLRNAVIPSKPKSWSDEDYLYARSIVKVAQAYQTLVPKALRDFLRVLLPFLGQCQRTYLNAGWVSFDGLVVKARDLLRDKPRVRREIKQQFQAILVDEFQDSDPVQYELILYVAEKANREARAWSQIQLEPGKLFIVGDPKQSIYAFRRADIEAYDFVVHDLVLDQSAQKEPLNLCSNFRSHAGVLDPVNALCRRWFPDEAIKGVQPRYETLVPVERDSKMFKDEGVQIRIVKSAEDIVNADAATRAEAQELARWLAEEVLNKDSVCLNGESSLIQPRHVAILFRTLTNLRVYVEALRWHDIPFVTEGEKHFFERQEIVDFINLLRLLADPYDRTAMAGVLRSPLGGCSDDMVAHLFLTGEIDDWHRKSLSTAIPEIFSVLQNLRDYVFTQPVADALDYVLRQTPFMELTAASLNSEQAVANVRKLQDLVNAHAMQSGMGFRGMVHTLTQWIHDPPAEAESSLVDMECEDEPRGGAVRLMTIHKSKGLEFPMVIVAGLHHGVNRNEERIWVDHDWLTGCAGMRLGSYYSLGGLYLESKMVARQRAEQIRILYVAMTRAQRRLVLSAGCPTTSGGLSRGFFGMILSGLEIGPEMLLSSEQNPGPRRLTIGTIQILLEVVTDSKANNYGLRQRSQSWQTIESDDPATASPWASRYERMFDGYRHPLFVTPTSLGKVMPLSYSRLKPGTLEGQDASLQDGVPVRSRDRQILIGILAHRVLETWNFQDDPEKLPAWSENVCRRGIPDEWVEDAPGLVNELYDMFNAFVRTTPYAILSQAEILGREVPITVPWQARYLSGAIDKNDTPAVLHGVIDVVYRWKHQIWMADYKTALVNPEILEQVVANYRVQATAYREALQGVFVDASVKAKLIFVRNGSSVEV